MMVLEASHSLPTGIFHSDLLWLMSASPKHSLPVKVITTIIRVNRRVRELVRKTLDREM
jgi:hypothetical protein